MLSVFKPSNFFTPFTFIRSVIVSMLLCFPSSMDSQVNLKDLSSLLDKANGILENREPDSSLTILYFLEKKMNLSLKNKKDEALEKLQARVFHAMGYCYCLKQKPDTGYKYFNRSIEINKKYEIKDEILNSTYTMAYFKYQYGDPKGAIPLFKESRELAKAIKDRNFYLKITNDLSVICHANGNISEAIEFNNEAMKLTAELKDDVGLIQLLVNQSSILSSAGNYMASIETLQKARDLSLKIKYYHKLGTIYSNLGEYYKTMSDPKRSIDSYIEAEKYEKLMKEPKGLAITYNNLGSLFSTENDLEKATEYYQKSLEISIQQNYPKGIAAAKNNLGGLYSRMNKYDQAYELLISAAELREKLDHKSDLAYTYNALSKLFWKQKNIEKATDYQLKAIKIFETVQNKEGLGYAYLNYADILIEQEKLTEAKDLVDKCLENANKNKTLDLKASALLRLYNIQKKNNNYKEAIEAQTSYYVIRDSIKRTENQNELTRRILKSEYGQKEALTKAEYDKQQALADAELEKKQILLERNKQNLLILEQDNTMKALTLKKSQLELNQKNIENESRKKEMLILNKDKQLKEAEANQKEEALQAQRIITYSLGAGVLLVLGFLFVAIRGYVQKRKDNKLISEQKLIVEQQKIEVENQKHIVELQKHMVEEKQKEIVDSITYAKRLQKAILPPESHINQYIPENFVYYKPKDIVAGDFYWMETVDNITFIAAADSTGHGVPGALVSVVCSNALNRATLEFGIRDTGKLLDKTTELVLETFSKSGEDIKDGMDVSLLAIDHGRLKIFWSGANNQLWYIKPGEVKVMCEITADKQPIGKSDNSKPFTVHEIPYEKGTFFYLMTDGYPDQFGGAKGKKFKYKQLQELLIRLSPLAMNEQKNMLAKVFHEWQGPLEQVDDVTIIGLKL